MPASPYRVAPDAKPIAEPQSQGGNRDVAIPLALFWCVSVVRVVVAIARGEVFDTGATIAVVVAVCVPLALLESVLFRTTSSRRA